MRENKIGLRGFWGCFEKRFEILRISLCEGAVWVSGAVGELLGCAMFGALELVESVGANVDGFLAVVAVVVADEPPTDESDHECYGWNEHADGGTGAGDVDLG